MFHKHGGDIYTYSGAVDFSANINYLGMPPKVREAAIRSIDGSLHYPDPDYRSLRRALARRENVLNEWQLPEPEYTGCENKAQMIRSEHIICGNGAAELMFALAAAKHPRKALLAVPSFFEYEQALGAFGCRIHRYSMAKEYQFRLEEDFFDAIDEETDCIVLGNPNNPTGRLLESSFLDKTAKICSRKGILFVLDESFFDFLCEEDKKKTWSGTGKVLDHPNLFVIKSFTKMYAMPGLRFGYGICSDTELLEKMRALMQPWNVSVPAQAAAEAAAGELQFAKKTADLISRNKAEMTEWMEQAGYHVYPSNANFLLFEGPEDLGDFCLKEGWMIRDCSNFPGLEKGTFRICVRSREENRALMEVLKRGIMRWQK